MAFDFNNINNNDNNLSKDIVKQALLEQPVKPILLSNNYKHDKKGLRID